MADRKSNSVFRSKLGCCFESKFNMENRLHDSDMGCYAEPNICKQLAQFWLVIVRKEREKNQS